MALPSLMNPDVQTLTPYSPSVFTSVTKKPSLWESLLTSLGSAAASGIVGGASKAAGTALFGDPEMDLKKQQLELAKQIANQENVSITNVPFGATPVKYDKKTGTYEYLPAPPEAEDKNKLDFSDNGGAAPVMEQPVYLSQEAEKVSKQKEGSKRDKSVGKLAERVNKKQRIDAPDLVAFAKIMGKDPVKDKTSLLQQLSAFAKAQQPVIDPGDLQRYGDFINQPTEVQPFGTF